MDVALLEVSPLRLEGFDTLHRLKCRSPDTVIVMVSSSNLPEESAHSAIWAPADACRFRLDATPSARCGASTESTRRAATFPPERFVF